MNLSPRQFQDGDVTAEVAGGAAGQRLPAAQLTLEMTEGVLVRDLEAVVAELQELRELGVRIAIDDFGTGFSSLVLPAAPPGRHPQDRPQLRHRPAHRASATTLISSIVELARTLGLDVVAEGVETEGQRRALNDLQCASAQGYLFARPEPAARCTELLLATPAVTPAG